MSSSRQRPIAPQILITTQPLNADVLSLLEAGLSGVMWRAGLTSRQLVEAVIAVKHGETLLPGAVQGQLVRELGRLQENVLKPRGLTASGLSEREIAILRMLSTGYEISEIAAKLSYSERTVKNVLHSLLVRMGIKNRVQAVSYAIRAGVI